MRAALLLGIGEQLHVEDVELLAPGPHDAVVRVEATAVCLTDVLDSQGHGMAQPPTLLGHAAAGVVEEVGSNVARVRVGDRVVVTGTPECGVCYWCSRGEPSFCEQLPAGIGRRVGHRSSGEAIVGNGGIGTFAERVHQRESCLVPVAGDVPFEHLCTLGCGAMSGLGAVLGLARVEAGSSMAVVGAGQLGLWMVQGGRVAGAGRILVVEPRPERREVAARLGATHVVDPADGDPVEQVRDLTGGRGADYVFEAAGPPEAIEQAFRMTRHSGTFVPTGFTDWQATVTFNAAELALGARRIVSCQYGGATTRRDVPRFAALMEAGLVDPASIVDARFGLDEINEAFEAAYRREVLTGVVLPAVRRSSP